jgi:hypothetical protein
MQSYLILVDSVSRESDALPSRNALAGNLKSYATVCLCQHHTAAPYNITVTR